jgi:hypothetical protein
MIIIAFPSFVVACRDGCLHSIQGDLSACPVQYGVLADAQANGPLALRGLAVDSELKRWVWYGDSCNRLWYAVDDKINSIAIPGEYIISDCAVLDNLCVLCVTKSSELSGRIWCARLSCDHNLLTFYEIGVPCYATLKFVVMHNAIVAIDDIMHEASCVLARPEFACYPMRLSCNYEVVGSNGDDLIFVMSQANDREVKILHPSTGDVLFSVTRKSTVPVVALGGRSGIVCVTESGPIEYIQAAEWRHANG